MTRLYIAYGSNLNIQQMQTRCPDARIVGTTVIPDYRLLFRGSKTGSYLTIEPMEGSTVPAAVWSISTRDERYLDRYEGYPTFYYKVDMNLPVKDIDTGETKNMDAFAYVMYADRPVGVPSNSYFMTCAHGYRSFGFDTQFLLTAYDVSQGEAVSCAIKQ